MSQKSLEKTPGLAAKATSVVRTSLRRNRNSALSFVGFARIFSAMPEVRITWRSADGEEREELWPSVERFRLWARAQGLRCAWTAYCQPPDATGDDDDEWLVLDLGHI